MKKIHFILALILFSVSSCRDGGLSLIGERFYSLDIINNSSKPIYFYQGNNGDQYPNFTYLDTTLPLKKISLSHKIEANGFWGITSLIKWDDITNSRPKDTLVLFLFDADVLEHTDWDSVRTKYLVLKRYDVDVAYLKKTNYTITYP